MRRDVLVLLMALQLVLGSPDGAPASACETMIPGHGVSAQISNSPYSILVSSPTYSCGASITVTLQGASFQGFLCQARTNPDNYSTTVGTLSDTQGFSLNQNCGAGRGLTHSESNTKAVVAFSWWPSTNHGSVTIVCSIVQTEQTFWVKETSEELTYGTNCITTDPSTDDTSSDSAGTTQNSTSSNNVSGIAMPSSAGRLGVPVRILLLIKLARPLLLAAR